MIEIIKSLIKREPVDWKDICVGIGYVFIALIALFGIAIGVFISKVF